MSMKSRVQTEEEEEEKEDTKCESPGDVLG